MSSFEKCRGLEQGLMRLVKFELEKKFRLRSVHQRPSGAHTAPGTKVNKKQRVKGSNETTENFRQFNFDRIGPDSLDCTRKSGDWFKTFSRSGNTRAMKKRRMRQQSVRKSQLLPPTLAPTPTPTPKPLARCNSQQLQELFFHSSPADGRSVSKLASFDPTPKTLPTSLRQHTPDFRRSSYYRKMKLVLGRTSCRALEPLGLRVDPNQQSPPPKRREVEFTGPWESFDDEVDACE